MAELFKCPAIEVHQPIGTFYVASMMAEQVTTISYADERRLAESDVDVDLGVNRKLDENRVEAIRKYITTVDATFPTSIVLAIDERCLSFAADRNELTIVEPATDAYGPAISARDIARILDGQHRLAGFRELQERRASGLEESEDVPFGLSVTIFPSLDIADQAYVFATVNLAQTKVNRSLVFDLFAYAKSRSPQKTSHNIAVVLNRQRESPFHKRIKRLGTATPHVRTETITQATFVTGLMNYISREPIQDRDWLLRGKSLRRATYDEFRSVPFRNLFIDNKDDLIADIVWNYFESVKEKWPVAWADTERGGLMLAKTNGFRAFMRILGKSYITLGGNDKHQPEKKQYRAIWDYVPLVDGDFNTNEFRPGTSGEAKLLEILESALAILRTKLQASSAG